MVNHNVRLLGCHDLLSYYVVRTFNLERILSLYWNQYETFTYRWDPNVVIYLYELGHYWWSLMVISILYKGIMTSYRIETICPLSWSKGHVIMKFVVVVIPLMEFDICSLKVEYDSWPHNRRIYNSMIEEVILMGL